jgi:hypothetical protein
MVGSSFSNGLVPDFPAMEIAGVSAYLREQQCCWSQVMSGSSGTTRYG